MRVRFLLAAALLAVPAQFIATPTASAECTTEGNFSMCSLGGLDNNNQPGAYVPFPCGYDYYCNDDWGWFIP